jgi:hypothetical protein
MSILTMLEDACDDIGLPVLSSINEMGKDGGKPTLDSGGGYEYRPFINVPDGSWNMT